MAKVRNNPVVRGINGSLGNLVFRQMPDGSTYISGKHDFSRRKLSQGQQDHHSRFQRAVMYARDAAKSQPIYAQLAAGTILSPYNIALSDWFHPPVIHEVKCEEGRILVNATDNVLVVRVFVTILNEEGEIREKGEGLRGEGDWWEYGSATEGRVRVEARDLAGNVTRQET